MTEIQEVCAATDEIIRSNATLQKSNKELLTTLNEVNQRVECVIYIIISTIMSVFTASVTLQMFITLTVHHFLATHFLNPVTELEH